MSKKDLKIVSERNTPGSPKTESIQETNTKNGTTSYFQNQTKKTPITTSIRIYQEDWDFIKAIAMYKSGLAKMNGDSAKILPMDVLSDMVDELRSRHNM
ncbi:MAG: hypothetical protein ACQPRJ_06265 [Solitalea-like symbiont of Acarus siro]